MKPLRLWMRLLAPFSRCQSGDIEDQFDAGVRMFDVRVRMYRGHWHVSHGPVVYRRFDDLLEFLGLCAGAGVPVRVRILLEGTYGNGDLGVLKALLASYPEITFFTGRDRRTWSKALDLEDVCQGDWQYVGSMQSWYGKLCPWLWWRLHRDDSERKFAEFADGDGLISLDFIRE